MNDNQNNFGLDSIQPLEPVVPVQEHPTVTESTQPEMETTTYAFQAETPVVDPAMPVEPMPQVDAPIVDPVAPVEPIPQVESESVVTPMTSTTSFTEIPVASVTSVESQLDVVNEHPDAKISLHKEEEEVIPVASNLSKEETMDKSTLWMLIWLFVGMLAVIIALPYLFELF